MKGKKLVKTYASFLLVANLFIGSTLAAYAEWAPQQNGQNKNNWCWLTTSKIVGSHNGGGSCLPTRDVIATNKDGLHSYGGLHYYGQDSCNRIVFDYEQRTLDVWVKGNDADNSGNDQDKERAMTLIPCNSVTVGTVGVYNSDLTQTQIDNLNAELAAGRWVIGNVINSALSSGHSIIIKSYNTSTDIYTIYDTWTMATITADSTMFTQFNLSVGGSSNKKLRWFQYCR